MRYRYHARITRAGDNSAPVWDDELNEWKNVTGLRVLYDDKCLVQDAGEVHPRIAMGMPHLQSDATVILRDKSKITLIEPDDAIEVTYPDGSSADGRVNFAREIDGVVLVTYL